MNPDPSIVLTSFTEIPNFVLVSILILVGLLILSAFFSLSETAFTSLNEIRIENLASARHGNGGHQGAPGAARLFLRNRR